jgi:hypothetical protein
MRTISFENFLQMFKSLFGFADFNSLRSMFIFAALGVYGFAVYHRCALVYRLKCFLILL